MHFTGSDAFQSGLQGVATREAYYGKLIAAKVQRPDVGEMAGLNLYLVRSTSVPIMLVSQGSHAFG